MKTYIVKTLGCKVNQYEGQLMAELLERQGLLPVKFRGSCDLVVVNTCTVTGEADRKSRYEIRKLNRQFPEARIVVTGCYAERQGEVLGRLPGVRMVIGQRDKHQFSNRIRSLIDARAESSLPAREHSSEEGISKFPGHGRAFVKVQDGCNKACTFCKVVIVRGGLKSRPLAFILREAERLIRAGYRELVLTGIQLGAYGKDDSTHGTLAGLIRRMVCLDGLERLRLSSINPYDVTDELIDRVASEPKCCPHLHIPLQSGANRVLERMRRGYTREDYLDRIRALRERICDFSLTLDCMVGFPGETDQDFEETIEMLDLVRPLKIHAFPYSLRTGTRASRFPDHVPAEIIKKRMKKILGAGCALRAACLGDWIGRMVAFLVEEYDDVRGAVQGVTPHYLPVTALGDAKMVGKTITRQITHIRSDILLAA